MLLAEQFITTYYMYVYNLFPHTHTPPPPPPTHTHTQCKLELKPLEPVYRDVRVVLPHLECSLSVEYDQFSTVSEVLHQVLSMSDPPLDPAQGFSLYHVRLRTK